MIRTHSLTFYVVRCVDCGTQKRMVADGFPAKEGGVPELAREVVLQGLPKDARWEDYADRLLESLPSPAAGD